MRLLVRREHAAHELTQKLLRQGYVRAEVELALRECQTKGFQSDTRFAEMLCRARIRQGYGPLRMIQELKMQQIDEAVAQAVFITEEVDWLLQARASLVKQGWRWQEGECVQKQQRYLSARGFPGEMIRAVLREKV